MGQRMIDFLALLIQHHICEVIIFINDKIKMRSGFSRMKILIIQFTYKIGLCFHLLKQIPENNKIRRTYRTNP